MGILSIMNRNLLSKFKSTLKPLSSSSYSSDPCYIRRFIVSAATAKQTHYAPTLTRDLQPNNRKLVFLIERFEEKSPEDSLLFSAAAADDDDDHNSSLIEGIEEKSPKYSLLFSAAAADDDNSSWKDRHHPILNPFSGPTTATTTEQLLLGSCNELTLFYDNDSSFEGESRRQCRLSLWNPTTNRIHTLPLSHLPRPDPVSYTIILCSGFGFDPKSQDYKFISFLEYNDECGFESSGVELYSLKTDSWKRIDASPGVIFQEPSVHINGVYYWGDMAQIISFDFADEEFSVLRLPEAVELLPRDVTGYLLVEFHGSLATLVHTDPVRQADEPFSFEVLVWDGKTWNCGLPRVTIGDDVLAAAACDKVHRVLGLFQNDFLLLQSAKGELMLFDVKASKLENLGIHAALDSEATLGEPTLSVFPFFVPI